MSKYRHIKEMAFDIIERDSEDSWICRAIQNMIMVLIIMNLVAIVLESFDGIRAAYGRQFDFFEVFSVVVFTAEYLIRLWTADLKYRADRKYISLFRFIGSPMAVIDFLAIFPSYLMLFSAGLPINFMFLRILRLTRLLRIFKLTRYTRALNLVGKVIKDKKEELAVTVFITFILVLIASTIMYYVEHDVNPDAFPNIGAAFWWAIATLTTIGYGDVYPATGLGRLLSALIALSGIGLVALPTGIISSSFMEELNARNKKQPQEDGAFYCPHCGKKIDKEH